MKTKPLSKESGPWVAIRDKLVIGVFFVIIIWLVYWRILFLFKQKNVPYFKRAISDTDSEFVFDDSPFYIKDFMNGNGELGDVYATILTESNINYFKMAIIMSWTMIRIDPDHNMLIVYGEDLSDLGEEILQLLQKISGGRIYLAKIHLLSPGSIKVLDKRWIHMASKFLLWNFTSFRKISFFDADHLIMSPLSEIFDCDSTLCSTCDYGQISRGCVIKPTMDNCGCLNAGFLIISPNSTLFPEMIHKFYEGNWPNFGFIEQDFLTYYFRYKWKEIDIKYNAFQSDTGRTNDIRAFHIKTWETAFNNNHLAVWKNQVSDFLSVLENFRDKAPSILFETNFFSTHFDEYNHLFFRHRAYFPGRQIINEIHIPNGRDNNPMRIQNQQKKTMHTFNIMKERPKLIKDHH